MHWETKIFVTHFITIFALLWWSGVQSLGSLWSLLATLLSFGLRSVFANYTSDTKCVGFPAPASNSWHQLGVQEFNSFLTPAPGVTSDLQVKGSAHRVPPPPDAATSPRLSPVPLSDWMQSWVPTTPSLGSVIYWNPQNTGRQFAHADQLIIKIQPGTAWQKRRWHAQNRGVGREQGFPALWMHRTPPPPPSWVHQGPLNPSFRAFMEVPL